MEIYEDVLNIACYQAQTDIVTKLLALVDSAFLARSWSTAKPCALYGWNSALCAALTGNKPEEILELLLAKVAIDDVRPLARCRAWIVAMNLRRYSFGDVLLTPLVMDVCEIVVESKVKV